MTRRRGVTLLELLIALALLLAMTALIAPAMVNRLDERAFENAAEVVRQQLLLARAHAASTGRPVEVLYRSDPSRVIARRFEPDADELPAENGAVGAVGIDEQQFEATLPEPWAYRQLPEQMQCSHERPLKIDAAGPELGPGLRQARQAEAESPATLRLAVYMPDGSALLGDPIWLSDDDGRLIQLVINHWTGLPTLERVADTPEPDVVEEDEAEESEPPQPPLEDQAEPIETAEDEPVEQEPEPEREPDPELDEDTEP
ncbi:MAG: prepilin-type N-terminal cleavage/methylation domain-containing protein [Planctomycetota bacterium]